MTDLRINGHVAITSTRNLTLILCVDQCICSPVGLPSTLLSYQFGYRLTVIIGGFIAALGLAASGFLHEFYHVILFFGILAGKGY